MASSFKVLIAGGSITGLSLAIMLERNNIDYLVLEAYPEIAPQTGASIGLLPHGFRILDQLGCYKALCEHVRDYSVQYMVYRKPNDEKLWDMNNVSNRLAARHGYPMAFIDRQTFIQTLYDKIQDKTKVLTSKRVKAVNISNPDFVRVTTTDGSSYSGDILVGADGIHSTVRQEMARLDIGFERDYLDEKSLSATYCYVFGISHHIPGIGKGTFHHILNEKFSYLIANGPDDRTYFFLFEHMGKIFYGSEIPRFRENDLDEIVNRHLDDPITPDVKFRDVYSRRIRAVMTFLEENVCRKWYFERIVALGDSSHKVLPLTGHGGNSALETAACFTNALVKSLQSSSPRSRLSQEDLASVLETVQRTRIPRVSKLMKDTHRQQKIEALDTPELKARTMEKMPSLDVQTVYNSWIRDYSPAVSLDMLPLPERSRLVPYQDELEGGTSRRKVVALL